MPGEGGIKLVTSFMDDPQVVMRRHHCRRRFLVFQNPPYLPISYAPDYCKGQLILKCHFGVFKSPKKPIFFYKVFPHIVSAETILF